MSWEGGGDQEPECGIHFCCLCGDCLHCYGGDSCARHEDGPHVWPTEENIQYYRDQEVASDEN